MSLLNLKIVKSGSSYFFEADDGKKRKIIDEVYYKYSLFNYLDGKNIDSLSTAYEENEKASCYNQACKFLSIRQHTVYELKRKLYAKHYSKITVEYTINKCIELSYLDDVSVAKSYTEQLLAKGYGSYKIKKTLISKGLDKSLIENLLKDFISTENAIEAIEYLLEKKLTSLKNSKITDNRKIFEKLYRYLIGRGYSSEMVLNALKKLNYPQNSLF